MSVKALFAPTKATLNLSAITAMNTAMTNVLLAKMVFSPGNPVSPMEIFKHVSEQIIKMVLDRAEYGELTKTEIRQLEALAEAYREILKLIE